MKTFLKIFLFITLLLIPFTPSAFIHASANSATPLPQAVYDQWADPSVSVINMPPGTFYLPGNKPLVLNRSNVTVNFAGTTLLVNPTDRENDSFYPIQVASTTLKTQTYPNPAGSNSRYVSHLTGTITDSTTQLTMDPNEIVNVSAGETVLIWAGVTPTDPVEAEYYIPATIASVNPTTHVITFTQPLGKNITNYGSLAALRALTSQSEQWKVGPWGTWPSDSNFSKGYGVDHGMERFVGNMVHDVIFNNLTFNLDPVNSSHIPNGMWEVSAIAVKNFTLNNYAVNNPFGSAVHLWRSFDALVNGVTLTGAGLAKIWTTDTSEAAAFSIWGGDRLTFRNVSITGTNMVVFNVEVGAAGIWLDGLNYDVTFTNARSYVSSPIILGFFSVRDNPRVSNASLKVATTGGSAHNYFVNSPLFDGYLRFSGSSLNDWFDMGAYKSPKLGGTVTINNIQYGPQITTTLTKTITHGQGMYPVVVPAGLYTKARVRVTNTGDLRDVSDSFGNEYWSPATGSAWVNLDKDKWYSVPPGDSGLATYLNKSLNFWLNNNGSTADATAEIEITYLPATGSTTPSAVVGDINLDHIVNSLDWSYMNSKWFTTDTNADLNHDGLVNAIDFSMLNANWFKSW